MVCDWPDLEPVTIAGVDGGFLGGSALGELAQCRERCDTTRALASANADAVDACVGTVAALNDAGANLEALAEDDLEALRADLRKSRFHTFIAGSLAVLAVLAAL